MQLMNRLEVSNLLAAVAAGTTTQQSSALSTNGADNFLFMILMGTLTATTVPVISIQGSTDGTNFSDLAGTGVTLADTDDGCIVLIEIDGPIPTLTHLRVQITRPTANAVIDRVVGIRRGRRLEPVTQGTLVHASSKYVISPAVGTA